MSALAVAGIVLVLIVACSAPSAVDVLNATVSEDTYALEADIPYGSESRQTMDFYRSLEEASASNPLVVFVYGGAWRSGKKEDYKFVAQSLTVAGYSVLIPDYRLYPDVQYPAFVDDVVAAVQAAIAEDAIGEGSDRRFVLMGHSSGAHSAALLAADDQRLGDLYPQVAGLVGISGPYDLPLDDDEVAPVFAAALDEPDSVNPVALATSGHPHTLLLHGLDDERVAPRHSRRYAEALREADVPLNLSMLEGVGHTSIIASLATTLDFVNPALEITQSFLSTVE